MKRASLIFAPALLLTATASGPAEAAGKTSTTATASQVCTGASGAHILFLMFLNAPPGVAKPDWVLQTMNSMEFATCEACAGAAQSIANSIAQTPTINLAGWCFPKEPAQAGNFLRSEKIGPENIPLTPPLKLGPQR